VPGGLELAVTKGDLRARETDNDSGLRVMRSHRPIICMTTVVADVSLATFGYPALRWMEEDRPVRLGSSSQMVILTGLSASDSISHHRC
jgi:hypothetical protein